LSRIRVWNVRPKTLGDNTGPTAACPPERASDATTGKTCVDCWKNGLVIEPADRAIRFRIDLIDIDSENALAELAP